MNYNNFIKSNQAKTEGDRFTEYLHKNKYFEIPFITKSNFSLDDWRKYITESLNSVFFDTSFQKPLGIVWNTVDPYLSTFHNMSDQIKGLVRLTFSDNSKKVFMVTIDGITKDNTWLPEIVRIQNHVIETSKKESFDITNRSTQVYGTTNPASKTPEPTDRPVKKYKRLLDMGKEKLKKMGKGRNQPEEISTEPLL